MATFCGIAPRRHVRAACPILGALLLGSGICFAFAVAFVAPSNGVAMQHDAVALPAPSALGRPAAGNARLPTATRSSPFQGFGAFVVTVGALLCAASRRMAPAQRKLVVRRIFPSACGRPKQKVLRRLQPFGDIPAWTKKPLRRRRLIQPWRKHPTRRPSFYKRQLLEKQRVRFHYNVNEHQLQVYMRRAFRKGVEYPMENFIQQLESRLDNFCWRVGLCVNMAAARHFVRKANLEIKSGTMTEFRRVNVPSYRLKIGDQIRVTDREGARNHARFNMAAVTKYGNVRVPAHLSWDPSKLEGEYKDICDPYDVGLDVQDRYITMIYSGQRGLRRKHTRYFEGTDKVISKRYNGGKTRPTPENLLNIKRGIGLNSRGRRRPPALWGRKKPLNSPYYE